MLACRLDDLNIIACGAYSRKGFAQKNPNRVLHKKIPTAAGISEDMSTMMRALCNIC